jgi:hypothetical protein
MEDDFYMNQKEEVMSGKEDSKTDNALVAVSSPPPKLNLRRLESIQRLLQYGSVLVLFIFIILIVIFLFGLLGIKREFENANANLTKINTELTNKNAEITNRQSLINRQEEIIIKNGEKINEQEVVIGKYVEKSSPKVNKEILENTTKSIVKEVLEKNPDTVKSLPDRIFIQISEPSQRIPAQKLQKQLQSQGYIVPGIDYVEGQTKSNSYLTYCKGKGDPIKAQDITNLISNLTGIKIPSPNSNSAKGCDKGSFGVYELWLKADFKS